MHSPRPPPQPPSQCWSSLLFHSWTEHSKFKYVKTQTVCVSMFQTGGQLLCVFLADRWTEMFFSQVWSSYSGVTPDVSSTPWRQISLWLHVKAVKGERERVIRPTCGASHLFGLTSVLLLAQRNGLSSLQAWNLLWLLDGSVHILFDFYHTSGA